jgi:hypothetical protein
MGTRRTGGRGMGGRDDLKNAGVTASRWEDNPTEGFVENKPNELESVVIRLQRVCGHNIQEAERQIYVAGLEFCRSHRPGRSTTGVCMEMPCAKSGERFSKCSSTIHAAYRPPVAFPSLRAHEPNPAGRDPTGPGRRKLKTSLLTTGYSGPYRRSNCANVTIDPTVDQTVSINEPAHPDIHSHTERKERKQY